jgi:hypothetical protein
MIKIGLSIVRRVVRVVVVPFAVVVLVTCASPAGAQVRGLYTPGMNATNSGVLPDAGLTFVTYFQLYSFDTLKGPNGTALPGTGTASVFLDQNIFMWTTKHKLLGATYAALADFAWADSSLALARFGTRAGGGGFSDSYYSPLTLGWTTKRVDAQAGYAFVAPTGRFEAGATDNTGAGYWGHFLQGAQTAYLTANKGTALSAFEAYEFHTTQQQTSIHPGQTFDIDYSLTQALPLDKDMHDILQVGLVGYGQYQTTDRSGPGVDPTIAANTHYKVNALGVAANMLLLARKVSVGAKYFKEFSNSSTVQGHELEISAAVTF